MTKGQFSPEFFKFLKDLAKHNDRDWFAANKERYESTVRDPALRFIADFAAPLGSISHCFRSDPKPTGGSMFRIYRDIRFSKDKSPYKTHVAMSFFHADAGKETQAPGFYLHLEPGTSFAGAGLWHPDPRTLTVIRSAIVEHPKEWQAVRRGTLEIEGERLTKPPRGFDPNHQFVEDLKLKDFVTTVKFSEKQVCSPGFIMEFAAACKKTAPLVRFLTTSIGLDW